MGAGLNYSCLISVVAAAWNKPRGKLTKKGQKYRQKTEIQPFLYKHMVYSQFSVPIWEVFMWFCLIITGQSKYLLCVYFTFWQKIKCYITLSISSCRWRKWKLQVWTRFKAERRTSSSCLVWEPMSTRASVSSTILDVSMLHWLVQGSTYKGHLFMFSVIHVFINSVVENCADILDFMHV